MSDHEFRSENVNDSPREPPAKRGKMGPNKPPFRGNRGKPSGQKRQDSYRQKIGAQVMADRKRALDAKYDIGLPLDNLHLDGEQGIAINAAPVQVSTRGVGAATAVSYSTAAAEVPKVLTTCTIHQAYRCVLLQFAVKYKEAWSDAKLPLRPLDGMFRDEIVSYEIESIVKSFPRTFSLCANIFSGIGVFEFNQGTYHTVVPSDIGDMTNAAFRVTSYNLRTIVDIMSSNEAVNRGQFATLNPIPGAVYTATQRMTNGTTVIPAGWPDRELVISDFTSFEAMLNLVESKRRHLVASFVYSGRAQPFALVNYNIAAASIATAGRITGANNIYTFSIPYDTVYYSLFPIGNDILLRGALSLLGENLEEWEFPERSKRLSIRSASFDWNHYSKRAVNR